MQADSSSCCNAATYLTLENAKTSPGIKLALKFFAVMVA
jgi:hypothetical protein